MRMSWNWREGKRRKKLKRRRAGAYADNPTKYRT
jgi:hypothetical protein